MMNAPKVSFIVPFLNAAAYLSRCAESLFTQTLADCEFVFIDDGSTDESCDVLEKTLERFPDCRAKTTLIRHPETRSILTSRMDGFAASSGKYVMHADADDFLDADAAEKCFAKAEEESADIVVFQTVRHTFNGDIPMILTSENKDKYLCDVLNHKAMGTVWGKCFRREFLCSVPFRLLPHCNTSEDYLYYPQALAYSKKISCIQDVFYHYNQCNTSSTTYCPGISTLEDVLQVLHVLEGVFTEEPYLSAFRIGAAENILLFLKQASVHSPDRNELFERYVPYLEAHRAWMKGVNLPDKVFYELLHFKLYRLAGRYVALMRKIKPLLIKLAHRS